MPDDEESRAEHVRAAIASARIEGVEISPATLVEFDAFASGAIDADELVARVLALHGPSTGS